MTRPEAALNKINTVDPVVLPPSRSHPNRNAEIFQSGKNFSTTESLVALGETITKITTIIKAGNATGGSSPSNCNACVEGLKVAQELVREYPWEGASMFISLCNTFTPKAAYGSCKSSISFCPSIFGMRKIYSL